MLYISTNATNGLRKILGMECRKGFYDFFVVPVKGGYRLAVRRFNHDKATPSMTLICIGSNTPFSRQKDAVAAGLRKFLRTAKPLTPAMRAAAGIGSQKKLAA